MLLQLNVDSLVVVAVAKLYGKHAVGNRRRHCGLAVFDLGFCGFDRDADFRLSGSHELIVLGVAVNWTKSNVGESAVGKLVGLAVDNHLVAPLTGESRENAVGDVEAHGETTFESHFVTIDLHVGNRKRVGGHGVLAESFFVGLLVA